MELICKKEAIKKNGEKILHFTQGVIYDFKRVTDPDGFETTDDNGDKEVFFNTDLMFEKL